MTRGSLTHPFESSRLTYDGKDLHKCGPQDLVGIRLSDSTGIQERSLLLKISYAPIYQTMAPLKPFVKWARYWEDFEDNRVKAEDFDIDAKAIPFYPEAIPKIVVEQFDAWLDVIEQIQKILRTFASWDLHIDEQIATESLLMFKNLLLAPSGLKFEHLDNDYDTRLARLGPCAVVHELKAAIVGSKVCAYYRWQPFDKLQRSLKTYKRLLRKTDANPTRRRNPKKRNKRRYDESIEQQMPGLIAAVNKAWAAKKALEKQLDDIPEQDGDWDADIPRLHQSIAEMEREEGLAREKAHWQFQLIHYIKARVEEADIAVPPTPMQTWRPPRDKPPPESPLFVFPENWQRQSHVARAVGDISSSIRKLTLASDGSQRAPRRSLRLRKRIYKDEDDDDDDTDTISVCSTKTLVPESRVSVTDQPESSSRSKSPPFEQDPHAEEVESQSEPTLPILNPPRTLHPDWTIQISDSESESERESESKSDTDF